MLDVSAYLISSSTCVLFILMITIGILRSSGVSKKKKDPVDQLCMLINHQELVICLDSRFYGILLITVIYKRVNSRTL